jgi:hypothetical protein
MPGRVGDALALPGSQQFGARRVAQRGAGGPGPGLQVGEKKGAKKAMGKCRFYRDLVGFHGDFMGFMGFLGC